MYNYNGGGGGCQQKRKEIKNMANTEIRQAMKEAGLSQWQLGDLVGCSENTIQRKLRKELPEDMKQHFLEVIRNHRKDGEHGGAVDRK